MTNTEYFHNCYAEQHMLLTHCHNTNLIKLLSIDQAQPCSDCIALLISFGLYQRTSFENCWRYQCFLKFYLHFFSLVSQHLFIISHILCLFWFKINVFFNIMLTISNKLIFSISRRNLQWSTATRCAMITHTHTHTHTHTRTTHFRANAPSITSSKEKSQEQSALHEKINKELSEAMDETFPICNTLPQIFLMWC